jgi:hypothetical protein
MKLRLTSAQHSALDCAGIFEMPDGPDEELLRSAIRGHTLELDGRENISAAASAVNELSNAESHLAEISLDRDMRRGHQGASKALQHLASKLWMEIAA